MSRRFIPPGIAAFGDGPEADHARTLARVRLEGERDGEARGRQSGHAAGLAEGEARARAACDAEITTLRAGCVQVVAADTVAHALDQVLATRAADLAALNAAAGEAIAAALQTLFPTLCAHFAGAEIVALARAALVERAGEQLVLRAHPATLAAAAAGSGAAAVLAEGRLTLTPDPALAEGAAEIVWQGGGLCFDPETLLRRVCAALDPHSDDQDVPT